MKTDSVIPNLLAQKCPRCHTGNIFESSNMYNLSKLTKMNQHCSHCHESFRREPGFYFGAAYVSYGLMVGIDLAIGFLIYFLIGSPFEHAALLISLIVIVNLLITPPVFRYSRVIFLYMFVDFDPTKKPA